MISSASHEKLYKDKKGRPVTIIFRSISYKLSHQHSSIVTFYD
uniref:Uncharacterized protein n=1 Tax=Arundo donax TaxID=35708 RepID=A0A0A8Z970_ARUDO